MRFSKEGAVRFSSAVVAENGALIPLYTLLVPSKTRFRFLPSLERDLVRRGEQLLSWPSGVFSVVQLSPYIKSVSKLIDIVNL